VAPELRAFVSRTRWSFNTLLDGHVESSYRPIETKAKDHELFAHSGFLVRLGFEVVGHAGAAVDPVIYCGLRCHDDHASFQQERNESPEPYFA